MSSRTLRDNEQPDYGSRTYVYLSSVERVTGTAFNDVIWGDERNNVLVGGNGNDELDGSTGNDRLTGNNGDDFIIAGSGDDRVDGGAGSDTLAFFDARQGLHLDLNTTGVQNTGEGNDQISNIENILASDYDDLIILNRRDNYIDGDGGMDTVSYARARNGVTVDLDSTVAQDTGDGIDTFSLVENVIGSRYGDSLSGTAGANRIDGGGGNDIIAGADGDDVLTGGQGADTIEGGAGNDVISGGRGSDIIDGGGGIDTISFAANGEGIRINLAITVSQGTMEGNDMVSHVENVIGSAFGDRIAGSDDDNRLTGGTGADIFVFAANSGMDTVSDFSVAEGDHIQLAAEPVGITSLNGDIVIDLGSGNTITLTGVGSVTPELVAHIVW